MGTDTVETGAVAGIGCVWGVVDGATPVEVLEHLICQGAADLTAAERDWMLAIAEFDRREAYLSWAAPTCATWLSQYAGVDIRAARERVRVARALVVHPVLSAAMASGELSYSKVRALTRIADAGTMVAWIDLAVSSTTNQLERLISAYRSQLPGDPDGEDRQHLSRCVDHRRADDGSMVITVRLPAADGVTFLSALEQFVAPAQRDADGGWVPVACRRADAAMEMALAAADHHTCTGGRPVEDALVTVHTDLDTLIRHRTHHGHGHGDGCCAQENDEQADDGHNEHGEFEHGEFEHEDAHNEHEHAHDGHNDHEPVGAGLCVINGSGDAVSHPVAVPVQTVLRMMCSSLVQSMLVDPDGNPLMMGRRIRVVTGAILRALNARDTYCRFPGCTRQGRLQGHHCGEYWTENGPTDIDNMLRLCRFHHRWVHEGGWHTVAHPDTGFEFHAPDGRTLPAAPAVTADPARVRATGRHHRARPGTWYGDRLDLDLAISNIASHARRAATQLPDQRLIRTPQEVPGHRPLTR
jgi:hypothetical protein